ncbi:NEL-type E3 ubiquitin ligase domain-containing protein [Pseudomonas sp. GD03858]|uniref:dermonecrotic toxin domain-containing protein n=1 Tax=unclassified Pseudomonas TaxID=196821 RepID=UPI00244840A3|nr:MULTISPECIES: DUF6543 domain-containing protein [unclassified Pseudomonas]MDH0646074.1 NEL-type E3 ubiquitin ligase domain-containing protein [Pseudomonas sp. GD03867]MDH0661004.1 NEL-type E3 ubiquitin ligase domain-containing protein [Pseudomonas sp. GD03858]
MTTPNDTSHPRRSIHYSTVERQLPQWLKTASPELRTAMRERPRPPAWLETAIQEKPSIAKAWSEEHAKLRERQAQVAKLFEQLPDLATFARQQLSEAVTKRFGLTLDVDATYLVDARLIDASTAIDARQAVDRATRSLLQSALHNFDAAATEAGGMDAAVAPLKRSVILDHRRFMGTVPIGNALNLDPEAFADLCRTLDIGGQYHDRLHSIYYPTDESGKPEDATALAVYQTLGRAEESAFRQALHFARLKGDIDQPFYDAALATALDQEDSAATSGTVEFSLLSLWEVELVGIALVTLQEQACKTVALYTPDDSETPIKAFASQQDLQDDLRDRLRANIHYLDKHVAERDKASFSSRLADRLTPLGWSRRGLRERVSAPSAGLAPVAPPFGYSFLGTMAFQKVERHEKDAIFHAVPTHVVDLQSAKAHHALIATRVLTALNIAGFFVPGLGEAMLAVCVMQLAYEVYEGFESWQNDEQDLACKYLVDVAENIALMAAMAGVAKIVRGNGGTEAIDDAQQPEAEAEAERPTVETPSFIEELEDVEMPDGQVRLWKPDLTRYHSDQSLPETLEPDENGLRDHQGQRWLVIQGAQYRVEQATPSAQFRLIHPTKASAARPAVRHNGAGAWLLPRENPMQWTRDKLLQRMDLSTTHLGTDTARHMLQVSGIEEDALRRTLTENERLPAVLQDTIARFKLDQATQRLPGDLVLSKEFERAYERLPASQAPGAAVIRRVYPKLPTPVIDELLDKASPAELQALDADKVPLRLAEEIRVYQQRIRLARAYEGLYLKSVRSRDSERLLMHTLERLPGWPAETRLLLQQLRYLPGEHIDIGPTDTSLRRIISSVEAGYLVTGVDNADTALTPSATLHAALCRALPEAMTQLGITDEDGLRRLLQEHPLPRATARQVLGMQAVRPGYRSPMRLADGRLGYPLSGGLPTEQGITRQTLLDTIVATGLTEHTRRSAAEILMIITSPGRTQAQVLARLQTLLEQRSELQSRLDDWSEAISPSSDEAAQNYETLRTAIMQHWYDTALAENGEHTAELSIQGVPLTDVPMTLPAFFTSRIHRLRLLNLPSGSLAGWAQHERLLQRLLQQVPQLRELEVSRPYNRMGTPTPFKHSLSVIAEQLPNLQTLLLTNQNVPLTANDVGRLAGLNQLRRLDLSGNRFAQHTSPDFDGFSLDYLGLDNMQLGQWPTGLGRTSLGRIAHVSLRNNSLRSLPAFLFEAPDTTSNLPLLSLEGNDINAHHLQRLLLNERGTVSRVRADVPADVTAQLERAQRERQQLQEALDGWRDASSSSAPLTQAAQQDRRGIEQAINTFWANQERGQRYLRLRFEDVALENFPRRLPGFFGGRLESLVLTRVSGSATQLGELLDRFPNITRLTIDAHAAPTSALAGVLSRLTRLTHLEFRNMGLEIDQAMLEAFGRLPRLSSLDLSGNRIGAITQPPGSLSSNLTSLYLSNMSLQAWPTWCDRLLPLEFLDLSNNNITQLPDHILETIQSPMPISSVSLFGNPLSEDTIERVRTYSDSQHSRSFAMDLPDNLMLVDSSDEGSLLDHHHFPVPGAMDDTPTRADWMLGTQAQNDALSDAWATLEPLEDGNILLRLAGRLRNAAPYLDPTTRAAFCERVRMMLVTAAANDAERPIMSAIAEAALPDPKTRSQTCHDGVLQEFNNIELLMMNNRVLADAGDTLESLHQRYRQFFRMGELETLASQRTRPGDRASVRLTYRHDLGRELDLPLCDNLRHRSAAQLDSDELADVLAQVRERESSDAYLEYLLKIDAWTSRLRGEYQDRFSEIEQRFGEWVQAVSELDLPLAEELALQQNLQADKEQHEKALLLELTILHVRHE